MGGGKAFKMLGGKPLISWAIDALQPQVAALAISGQPAAFETFDLPVLPDPEGLAGPAAGVIAGLSWARSAGARGLLVTPCDTPFLPETLRDALNGQAEVCVPMIGERALWAISAWPAARFEAAIVSHSHAKAGAKGVSLRSLIQAQPYKTVAMPNEDDFFGINTPEALATAQAMLLARQEGGE